MIARSKRVSFYTLKVLGELPWGSAPFLVVIIATGLCLGLAGAGFTPIQVAAADSSIQSPNQERSLSDRGVVASLSTVEDQSGVTRQPKRANFDRQSASLDTRRMADWVVDSADNSGLPFAIVDKIDAKVFVFHTDGRLRGTAAVLLGLAKGDDAVPGIGNRPMSSIRPEERTTPAGRFVAYMGRNFYGKDILWVDYEGAVSIHRVVTNKPAERRLERLNTPTPLDNRISYGCINVPVSFFDTVVKPAFTGTKGIVYVLPEIRTKKEIFAAYYDVGGVGEEIQVVSTGEQSRGASQ